MAETRLEHWREWHERCALGRCTDTTRDVLQRFGTLRFRTYLNRWQARRPAHTPPMLPPDDAWHHLEVYMTVPGVQNGKRYKDWLFARAEYGSTADIERGASVIMRAAVRRYVTESARAPGTVSLDRIVAGTPEQPVTLGDLLPEPGDPVSAAETRELAALAAQQAAELAPALTARERIILAARARGLSLAHPAVSAAAACGKATLWRSYKRLAATLLKRIEQACPSSPGAERVDIGIRVFDCLHAMALDQGWDLAPVAVEEHKG